VGLGRTANTVIVGPSEGDDGVYTEVRTDGSGVAEPLAAPRRVRLLHDRLTDQLIGYSSGLDNKVAMFDPKAQARVQGTLRAFPNVNATIKSWSEDFSRLVVFTDGDEDPGTYWLVEIATGKARSIGSAYAVDGKDVGPGKYVDYKAADGTALQGVLTLPPGSSGKGLPLVVLPHGGPASHDEAEFDWWAQAFASRGYAVFQPNFRGSTGYGQALHDAGYGQWGRKMQTDITDGVAALAAEGVVYPKRACIVGGSYGGYAALAGVTVQHGQFRCAVAYAGVADLAAMLSENKYNDPAMRYWKTFMGVKGPGDAVLKEISPAALAAKADAPILLIHGKDDTVVDPKQSRTMERELKKAGKPVELIMLDGEDHWLSRGETRTAMLKAAVAFVE
jgi:dipeptidyl aminopeptidase/acylaminoacyl peptidase